MERALARTQREEADRLRAANDRLEKALRLEQEFLMTVSHELRTPLTAIRGWARMLATGAVQGEQQAAAIQSIERNARAQTRLVEDLLDMARVDGGTLRLDIKDVSLPDVVREAIETMTADAKTSASDDCRRGQGIISGDPERLQQIVGPLSNTIGYAERRTVDVRLERAGGSVSIIVRDTGAGISREFLPHVFDRFRQEDAGRKRRFGGLGLGLAIVKHLVDLHGGSIVVESDGQDHGSTFIVRLPVGPILKIDGAATEAAVESAIRSCAARLAPATRPPSASTTATASRTTSRRRPMSSVSRTPPTKSRRFSPSAPGGRFRSSRSARALRWRGTSTPSAAASASTFAR